MDKGQWKWPPFFFFSRIGTVYCCVWTLDNIKTLNPSVLLSFAHTDYLRVSVRLCKNSVVSQCNIDRLVCLIETPCSLWVTNWIVLYITCINFSLQRADTDNIFIGGILRIFCLDRRDGVRFSYTGADFVLLCVWQIIRTGVYIE